MLDGKDLGFKSNDISVHFSRQEAAYVTVAMESANDEAIETFLVTVMGWDEEKAKAYIAESQGIREDLVQRVKLINVLEGG
jgi:hypothetical protein